MEIVISGKNCIITPLTSFMDKRESDRLTSEISLNRFFNVGIDLSFVEDCTIDFFENLKDFNNISLFNISSDIFVLLELMGLDKKLNIYTSELDYIENKNRIVNRKFKMI